MIASAPFSAYFQKDTVICLALGVLIGGVLQLSVQGLAIFKKGIRFQKPKTLSHPGAKKVGRLLLPRLFGSAVYQLTVFVDTFCASLSFIVGAGGISAIYYSNRILQFPMGLFGIALASALLPTLSGFSARQDLEKFKVTLSFGLRSIFLIMIPMSAFLILYSMPIIRLLFERGEFGTYSTSITSWALFFYAMGLVFFAGIKILVTSFHALQDTATPAKVAGLCLVLNVFLNLILMGPLKIGGIALASSISAALDFVILFFILNKKLEGITEGFWNYVLRVLFAAVVMGSISLWAWNSMAGVSDLIKLITVCLVSLAVFFASCTLLKITEAKKLLAWILNKP